MPRRPRAPRPPGGGFAISPRTAAERFHRCRAYLDRAAPRFAAEKVLAPAYTRGRFFEVAPGSKCPGWIC